MARLIVVIALLVAIVAAATVQAETSSVEMTDAQLVDDVFLEMYDLPASALKLTKFEQHMAEQMEAEDDVAAVEVDAEAETETEAETEAESETEQSPDAEVDGPYVAPPANTPDVPATPAAPTTPTETGPKLVKPTIEVGTVGLPEPVRPAKRNLDKLKPCPKRAAKAAVLLEVVEAALEHVSEEPAAPALVKPTIEKGTVGLPEPVAAPKKNLDSLKPCPKKGAAAATKTALLEVEGEAPAPKVHVHVTTKLHGGPNSDNLIRIESKFDSLHDRVMGRLNKLMSRIERHPDSIEDKTAEYNFTA